VRRDLAKRIPLFWLLQIGGWAAYGLAQFLTTLPYLKLRDVLVYRGVITASSFAASFVLLVLCRQLWRRQTSWAISLLTTVGCSCVLGFLCSVAAVVAEDSFGRTPASSFKWSSPLGGALGAGFVLVAWSALYFGVKYYQALEAERRRTLAAEALAHEAELRALRYQIQPHFLFNTLNAISTLVVEGNGVSATRMIARLADFFRATLDGKNQNEVLLENEMFLAEQYLEIEKIRLGDRLDVDFRIDPGVLSALVPNLLLQPLIENAIRHGIAPRREGGRLIVSAEGLGKRIRIVIVDNGAGRQEDGNAALNGQAGIGIANIEERLRQLYGSDYLFNLKWPEGGGCEAVIELPLRMGRIHESLTTEAVE
jgi:two-component system LytT family sensor kinase